MDKHYLKLSVVHRIGWTGTANGLLSLLLLGHLTDQQRVTIGEMQIGRAEVLALHNSNQFPRLKYINKTRMEIYDTEELTTATVIIITIQCPSEEMRAWIHSCIPG